MREDQFMPNRTDSSVPSPEIVDEFNWLMFLALDDLLDAEDLVRFEAYLKAYPSLAELWGSWQAVDQQLVGLPKAAPAPGFVDRFEAHLLQQEQRQQRLVLGGLIGIVVVLGLATAASSMGVGVYVMLTQGQWIGQLIRSVALFSATIGNWMDAAVATVATVTNTPQARTVGIVYFGVALIVIAGWVQLLRRSARLSDAIPTPGLE